MKILLMTVGGSDEPLVTSIQQNRPDRIVFFCSTGKASSRVMVEGKGLVCGDWGQPKTRPNIVTQSNFPVEMTKIVDVNPDDPYDTYLRARSIISKYEGNEIVVDYTGGTKSMTAGLLLAGAEFPQCRPVVVTGARTDLNRVTGDLSRLKFFRQSVFTVVRYKESFRNLIAKQDYDGALAILKELAKYTDDGEDLTLDRLLLLTGAFADWDNFRYEAANEKLKKYVQLGNPPQEFVQFKITSEHLVEAKKLLLAGGQTQKDEQSEAKGALLAYDLLWNAERKASTQRFNDAVARLYRAEEMYAQFALLRLGIFTSNVAPEKLAQLPEARRAQYEKQRDEKGMIRLGLRDSYDLLADLEHPIGVVWRKYRAKLLDLLTIRNFSALAHGVNPVSQEEYKEYRDTLWAFIRECDEADPILRKYKWKLDNYKDLPDRLPEVL